MLCIGDGCYPHVSKEQEVLLSYILCSRLSHYTSGSLLSDQQNQAAAPAATHPTILNKSPSIMLINRAERLINPHSPANRVNIRLPAKPMTFMKVLDTIAFILIDLNILPSSVLMALNIAGCRRFNRDTLRHITTPLSRMARALYHHFVIKFCVFHQHFFHVYLARCTHRVFC